MTAVLEARQLAKTYETGGTKVLGLRGVDISICLLYTSDAADD